MKFNIYDKVWIKVLNRTGIVKGRSINYNNDRPNVSIRYDVMFESDYHVEHDGFSVMEYLGKKPTFVTTYESDLESIEDHARTTSIMDKLQKEINVLTGDVVASNGTTILPEPAVTSVDVERLRRQFEATVDGVTEIFRVPVIGDSCVHKWEIYDSGWSKFEYCSKCDINKTYS